MVNPLRLEFLKLNDNRRGKQKILKAKNPDKGFFSHEKGPRWGLVFMSSFLISMKKMWVVTVMRVCILWVGQEF